MSQSFTTEDVSSAGPSRHAVDLAALLKLAGGSAYETPSVATYRLDDVEAAELLSMSGNN